MPFCHHEGTKTQGFSTCKKPLDGFFGSSYRSGNIAGYVIVDSTNSNRIYAGVGGGAEHFRGICRVLQRWDRTDAPATYGFFRTADAGQTWSISNPAGARVYGFDAYKQDPNIIRTTTVLGAAFTNLPMAESH